MGRNIKQQFLYAINQTFSPCANKHSLKAQGNINTEKTFSYSSRENLVNISANFSNFLKENHPDVKKVKNIKAEHFQDFFNTKAVNCSAETLAQYKSNFSKLEKIVNKVYNTHVNYQKDYVVPLSQKNNGAKIRDIATSVPDYFRVLEAAKGSRSKAVEAISLTGRFGLRVSESTKLQARDINLDKNIMLVVDSKGKKTIAKEIKPQDREYCEKLVATYAPNDRIVPIQSDSVNRFLARTLEKTGLNEKYKECKTGMHAIRKMAAQIFYDECRKEGLTVQQSLDSTSEFLGHGKNRNELMQTYIAKIH